MTCPGCQYDNPSHANFCLECGVHLRSTAKGGPSGAPYPELQRALTEGAEQQRATAKILRVISRSHSDAQPVFDAIVESAVRLVSGQNSVLFRLIAAEAHVVAQSGCDIGCLGGSWRGGV